jgi:serine/threonine protein kinase
MNMQPVKKLENLIILKTIGTGAEIIFWTLDIIANVFLLGKFSRVVLSHHETTRQYLALKIMSMENVIRLEQVEHVHNERNILKSISHPFLISLISSSMDTRFQGYQAGKLTYWQRGTFKKFYIDMFLSGKKKLLASLFILCW